MNYKQWIAFLAILAIIGFGWGFYQASESQTARIMVENNHERAFYDLLGSVENLSVLSDKALIATGKSQVNRILSQLNTEAYVAQESLSMLPINHSAFSRTEQFLNQMGNFSYSLLVQSSKGNDLTEEQRQTLTDLSGEIAEISNELHGLVNGEESPFAWAVIKNAQIEEVTDAKKAGIANASFAKIDETLQEIPALVYDGPFSDHLESKEPVQLPGEEISWEEAKKIAKNLLGDNYTYEEYGKSGKEAAIPIMTLKITAKNNADDVIYLDISRTGGFPTLMTSSAGEGASKLSNQDALTKAEAFLAKTPYENMVPNYAMMDSNVLTINYVYEENDTLIYPDMIKISIDMTNGRVVGIDAQSYLVNHKDRTFSGLKLSAEEAKSNLPSGFSLESTKKAIIPLDNGDEVLCYEFRMKSGDRDYLVYINALTGVEEDILGIYHGPNGTFAL